ncbi:MULTISPECIES: nitric oxide reductase F protein [unclassified Roseovarius]|uniref:nitric oxide reductase F protein n=1 Tax=unclassified Roseovarius TaxID=2614913 RepID=UPI00273DA164|nr:MULTISPECIES: nitric oxide reductase F protein [unclassified Roseovarius]
MMAWLMLVGLSLGSTLLSLPVMDHAPAAALGLGVLLIAGFKARIILTRYLGLADAPFWRRGFDISLTLFCALLLGLYLAPLML